MSDYPAPTTPTTLRRQLGARLRALRQDRGLTADQVARDLGFSVSKVSRMETGARAVSQDDMTALITYFDLDREEASRLGEIAQAGKRRVRRSVVLQPASQESTFAKIKQSGFVELEWDAVRSASSTRAYFLASCRQSRTCGRTCEEPHRRSAERSWSEPSAYVWIASAS